MSIWQGYALVPLHTRAADPIFAQAVRKSLLRDRSKRAFSLGSSRSPSLSASNVSSSDASAPDEQPRPRRWLRWTTEIAAAILLFLAAAVTTDFVYFVGTLEAEVPNDAVRADGIIALTGGAEPITGG